MKPIIVVKFGGTSVGSIENIKLVAKIIKNLKEENPLCDIVVISSAMAGYTNDLVNKANELINNKHITQEQKVEYDLAVSSGEFLSISLISLALQGIGIKAKALTAYSCPIITDDNHTKANIKYIGVSNIKGVLSSGIVPIIAGFQGLSEKGNITTLGRGGSDTSGAYIAGILKACKYIIIYTVTRN